MSTFKVVVNPGLEAIMPRYMEIRMEELAKLEQALKDADTESLRMLGHKLKGTGTSYGFSDLTRLGAAIEIAGKEADMDTAKALATEIRSYLTNVEIVYGEK